MDAALILWNADVIDVVSLALEHRNLTATGIEPTADIGVIDNFISSTDARAVVFDVSPPYKTTAGVVRDLLDRFPDRAFIFTCADPVLAIKAAQWLSYHPMIQKPYEPDQLVRIVERLVRGSRETTVVRENVARGKARVVFATLQ